MGNLKVVIFQFSKISDISSWKVLGDSVMGGRSNGTFKLNENGNGVYTGKVSLENNGGFSILKHKFDKINVLGFSKIIFKIKGDGKKYQFRIKDSSDNSHSYVKSFETNGDIELIEVGLNSMYPTFRGRNLDKPNFSSNTIEEVAILIGNKKEENFQLEIVGIYLQ